jgi:hypothetical protein
VGAQRPDSGRVRPGKAALTAKSGGAAFVMVMQTADVWDLDNRATRWRLDRPRDGRILVQGEIRAPRVIVSEVALEVAVQRALVPHDDVIEALAPKRADHAFNERILPGRTSRRQHFLDAHLLHGPPKIRSVNRVTIPDGESWRGVPRPRLAELLRGPRRSRMCRDVHVDDAASVVSQRHEHKQDAERDGGDGEEVDRGELGDVIGEEGVPRLGRGTSLTPKVLRHGGCDTTMPSFCNSP